MSFAFPAHTANVMGSLDDEQCASSKCGIGECYRCGDSQQRQLVIPGMRAGGTMLASHGMACAVVLARRDELLCDADDDRLRAPVVREVAVTQAARDGTAESLVSGTDHVQFAAAPRAQAAEEEDEDGEEGGEGPREGVARALYPQPALFMRQCLPESAWEPDEATAICRQCSRRFSLFLRRHHCRRCGLVFCDGCSSHRILLASPVSTAQSGYYAPASEPDDNTPLFQIYAATLRGLYWRFREHRACDPCADAVACLPPAHTSSLALVEPALGAVAIENAYNIFHVSSSSSQQPPAAAEGGQTQAVRHSSSASIRACPVCDRDWATVWSAMARVPGEGWQETQERHIRECIEDTAAEMQGAPRHRQPARPVRRSRSAQTHHHRPPADRAAAPPAQAAASQPRRSAGIMGLFERATSPVDTREAAAASPRAPSFDDASDSANASHLPPLPRSPPGIKYVAYKLNGDTPLLGQECPICFEDFEPGQRVARLNCLCTYHVWCINAWTMRTPSCPVHYN